MTEINSVNAASLAKNLKELNFTFERFVEYHNQRIVDQLIKQRKKGSLDVVVSNLTTPLSLSELNVAWSFYEDNFDVLEDIVYQSIAENYIDAHQDDTLIEKENI
jgi:hypothetical protein